MGPGERAAVPGSAEGSLCLHPPCSGHKRRTPLIYASLQDLRGGRCCPFSAARSGRGGRRYSSQPKRSRPQLVSTGCVLTALRAAVVTKKPVTSTAPPGSHIPQCHFLPIAPASPFLRQHPRSPSEWDPPGPVSRRASIPKAEMHEGIFVDGGGYGRLRNASAVLSGWPCDSSFGANLTPAPLWVAWLLQGSFVLHAGSMNWPSDPRGCFCTCFQSSCPALCPDASATALYRSFSLDTSRFIHRFIDS